MRKSVLIGAWLFVSTLSAQTVGTTTVNVNVQILSGNVLKAKYRVKLPSGMIAGSVVAENLTSGTMYIGQGSMVKALRDKGYPALGRTDAADIILRAQGTGFLGKLKTELPFAQKMVNDTQSLIVSGALHVAPGVGLAIAGGSALLNALAPDIVAQIQQFEQAYDTDGIQNILQLGPGQSAIGTVIFDTPPKYLTSVGQSFIVPVPAVQVTGQSAIK